MTYQFAASDTEAAKPSYCALLDDEPAAILLQLSARPLAMRKLFHCQ